MTFSAFASINVVPAMQITGVTFDLATHVTLAPGSDNWPVAWSDDGHMYSSWGDGGGFGGTNADGRVSLGVARIEGDWDNYQGFNVWGGLNPENPAQFGGKSYGMDSIGGVLYMWVVGGTRGTFFDEAQLARSLDHGATWTKANWKFVKAEGMVTPTILNFGQDYSGARDSFVYHYFIQLQTDSTNAPLPLQQPGIIYLLRSPRTDIFSSKSNYEYFAGVDAGNNAFWSNNIADKLPVFEDPNGVGWNMAVSYNPGLGRYLLTTEHIASRDGNLGLFAAPEPWGPWSTILYVNNWMNFGRTFRWLFANKWLSPDGLDFTMIFTGRDLNDSWNTIRGRFTT